MYRHRVQLLEASCTINHHKRVDHLRVHHEHLTDQLFALHAQASHQQCLVSCAITYWQSGTPTKHQPRWMSAASISFSVPTVIPTARFVAERGREFSPSTIMFSHSCKTEHYWMYVRGSPRHQIPGRVRSTLRPGTHRFRIRTVKISAQPHLPTNPSRLCSSTLLHYCRAARPRRIICHANAIRAR